MDVDLGWTKFGWEIVKYTISGGVAVVVMALSWRKADKLANVKALEKTKREMLETIGAADVDIRSIGEDVEGIKKRLASGDNRMTRIEEQLKHMPTQDQFQSVARSLAALEEAQKATAHTTSLIHQFLLSERGAKK